MIKFSIITPVYNGEKYIENCVKSIVNVGYDLNFIEHIIVDDGSTDKTKDICSKLAKKYPHIKFYSKKNGNWGSVINFVKRKKIATGDYVSICDADDFLLKGALTEINKKCYLKNGKRADFFQTGFKRWNGRHLWVKIYPYFFCFKRTLYKKYPMHFYNPLIVPQSVYMNKNIFYSTPDLKEGVLYQDVVLFMNAFMKVKTIKYTNKACSVYWYKRPGNSMSQNKIEYGTKLWVDNLKYFSDNNYLEAYLYYLAGKKDLKHHFKKNNIRFQFTKKKYDATGFPLYIRWAFKIMFHCIAKRFVEWTKK